LIFEFLSPVDNSLDIGRIFANITVDNVKDWARTSTGPFSL